MIRSLRGLNGREVGADDFSLGVFVCKIATKGKCLNEMQDKKGLHGPDTYTVLAQLHRHVHPKTYQFLCRHQVLSVNGEQQVVWPTAPALTCTLDLTGARKSFPPKSNVKA